MHDKSIDEVLLKYHSNFNGLTEQNAKYLLEKNGKNVISKEKRINPFKIFFKQLVDPLVYVLLAGFVLSLLLKEYSDALIIISIVFLNAFLSTFQECKAEKALKSLSSLTIQKCLVKRENVIKEIDSKDLVVGDIEILEGGKYVSGDLRLIESKHLTIDESSLTGESIPSEKDHLPILKKDTPLGDQKNMAFMSSYVIKGTGQGIVVKTGMNTQIGQIAKLIKEKKETITPLQKKLNEISKILAISSVLLCVIIFLIAIFQKRDSLEMLITAISLAVAIIPEGLLAVVTIVLSLGMQRLSKVNAILKNLPSVETLGCVNVICSDKTGTLTLNKMSVTKVYVNTHIYDKNNHLNCNELFLKALASCNDAFFQNNNYHGDPTEIAILKYCQNFNIKIDKRLDFIPFDSNRKMMSTLNGQYQFTKGAFDYVFKKCNYYYCNDVILPLNEKIIEKISDDHDKMSKDGLRLIAICFKKAAKISEDNLVFLGFVALIDPPRENVKESINTLKKAYIKTVMITGDHKNTAFYIAKELKIANDESQIITGQELDKLTQKELNIIVNNYTVFARVSPENKVMIVKAFQAQNNVVAMTGDGINDAPSLKCADIGISMGINGTDVAKNASDMVLMDDNFQTIEKAIKEGRTIFNNIKKTLIFLLSSNMGEVLVMLITILFNLPLPLIAIHILFVNLLTDTLPSLALGQDAIDNSIMEEPVRKINESIFKNKGWLTIIGYGLLIALISFFAYIYVPIDYLLKNNINISFVNIAYLLKNNETILLKAQTYSFSTLALSQLFHSIGIKNQKNSIFNKNTFNNKLLIFSLLFGILLQFIVTTNPFFTDIFKTSMLNLKEFFVIILFSIVPLFVHEITIVMKK